MPGINGDNSWELPLPATYVLAPDRKIALAEIELDYRERLEPDALRRGAPRAALRRDEGRLNTLALTKGPTMIRFYSSPLFLDRLL